MYLKQRQHVLRDAYYRLTVAVYGCVVVDGEVFRTKHEALDVAHSWWGPGARIVLREV